jgi:acyl-[acyl-carrier-protein]-phospholipid O-acyltransferase/long-chain-fatty-acid--[acyl-carrier-protein] ligase
VWLKMLLRKVLRCLYRLEVTGLEHIEAAGERVLIVSNHASYMDVAVLWAILPGSATFAVNTRVAEYWWVKPSLFLARTFRMEPTNPLAIRALIAYLRGNEKAVIFPEGRITVTGSLMKIYDGPALVADKADAAILPIRLDGTQYTPFSKLRGQVRLRWFPKIRVSILPPARLKIPPELRGRARHREAGQQLSDLMTNMMFSTRTHEGSLFDALVEARRVHGGVRPVLEDVERRPLDYDRFIAGALLLGGRLARMSEPGETVGLLLPNVMATVLLLFGLQQARRVPALLNHSAGAGPMLAACETARIRTVVTSRRFVERAHLENAVAALGEKVNLIYLDDLAREIRASEKALAWFRAKTVSLWHRPESREAEMAVILFTSGSEGKPKGVALSHGNVLANRAQLMARIDFGPRDTVLNALPLFHAMGLTAGTLLPLLSGTKVFLYPSPLHYRIIPEVAYEIGATLLFGTNTFLAGYARCAHPYDFYSLRYVFAGAEKLQEETRRQWITRFGLRVLEGYGATETSPVLSINTPMHCREGTVGRLLPGVEARLETVPGIDQGGRLHVRGPNIMLGYLLHGKNGDVTPPASTFGEGWYDTGDIVEIDADGYLHILGRAKRFAKVGGEMVSLAAMEELAAHIWPQALHGALALPDPGKGEQVWLVTSHKDAQRAAFVARAREEGVGEILFPKRILYRKDMPLLATGKVDLVKLAEWLNSTMTQETLKK